MTAEVGIDRVAGLAEHRADGEGKIADARTWACGSDASCKSTLRGLDHREVLRCLLVADDEADCRISNEAILGHCEIQGEQIAVGKCVVMRQTVQHRIVHGSADEVVEGPAAEGRGVVHVAGQCAPIGDHLLNPAVDVQQVRAHSAADAQLLQDRRNQDASALGPGQAGLTEDLDHVRTPARRRIRDRSCRCGARACRWSCREHPVAHRRRSPPARRVRHGRCRAGPCRPA